MRVSRKLPIGLCRCLIFVSPTVGLKKLTFVSSMVSFRNGNHQHSSGNDWF